jgi:hypothetical protein
MIRKIKIQNIPDIIDISKSMELNKCIPKEKIMKMFISMFLMIFQSLKGLGKSRCDIPSGTTQGQDYTKWLIFIWAFYFINHHVIIH